MSRLVPYRTKVSEEVAARIQQTLSTTMYLVQTTGPTSYVIQEQNCEKKHKVLIGSLQSCSCGTADICLHILFVMLKVLRVPATTPVVWQKSLMDSEIEMLLRGGYREQSRPAPKPFMKRRKEEVKAAEPEDADAERHELVEGEVCAICQEDMDDSQPLTFCRKGCGNNFHIECMKVFGESRRQSKENIICPLCRQDWGDTALSSLRKEIDAANRAPNVHKGASCRKCKTKPIRCERYRCVQCKNVDLCARCFKSNAHSKHAFVMKHNVSDPWVPASRENQPRTAISSDIIRDLENRELSTDDYDVLLQLDQGDKRPIQDYLVRVVSGTKVNAENAKTFGESGSTCSLCAQSLRIKASLHSTLCGHVFHESCLARSILAQMYACPYPGCDQALLPGLLHLQQKRKASKAEQPSNRKQEAPDAMPMLDPSFTVLGLQQQYSQGRVTGDTRTKVSSSRRTKRETNLPAHRDRIELPSLPGLLSVGIMPHKQPSMDERGSVLARNQLEHESVASGYSGRTSSTRSFAPHVRGKLVKPTRVQSELPALGQPVSSFSSDEHVTENRLNHAQKIRSELKAIEKERLQKQRLQREQRRQRHQESSINPAFTGVFLGAERAESVKGPPTRAHQIKLKSKERHQQAREQSHLPTTLPDLFVGNGR